jgi:hypothetical protein
MVFQPKNQRLILPADALSQNTGFGANFLDKI